MGFWCVLAKRIKGYHEYFPGVPSKNYPFYAKRERLPDFGQKFSLTVPENFV